LQLFTYIAILLCKDYYQYIESLNTTNFPIGFSMRTIAVVTVFIAIISYVLFSSPVAASISSPSTEPQLLPTSVSSSVSVKWWQWLLSIPANSNPIFSNPCNVKQTDQFFYLAGTFGGSADRNCTVPKGKPIFFPVINILASLDPTPDFNTLEKLKIAADGYIDGATDVKVSVDGVSVKNINSLRAQSPPFKVQDNLTPDGVLTAVSDGYWVPLKPLSVGQHTIHFAGKQPDFNFELDVTYHITVK
jgi:hypothetical protein